MIWGVVLYNGATLVLLLVSTNSAMYLFTIFGIYEKIQITVTR